MDGSRAADGAILVRVDGQPIGPRRLPQRQSVHIGRRPGSGVLLAPAWVPGDLATLNPVDQGWHLVNGARTRVRVRSRWLDETRFAPNAVVMLQRGTWQLSWDELDFECAVEVQIGRLAGEAAGAPYALDRVTEVTHPPQLTHLAGANLSIETRLRHRMAVLFEHEILESPAPANICLAASERLGTSGQAVKNAANRLKDRINEHRGAELRSLEQLGYYLVHVSQELGPDDLRP